MIDAVGNRYGSDTPVRDKAAQVRPRWIDKNCNQGGAAI